MPRRRDIPRERAPHGNLPGELTTFVGRVRGILEIHRLLNTRLALRVARESVRDYPDGAWFVELAAVANADRVPRSIADALGVQEETGQSILQTLTAHFIGRQALLLLDNCEHLAAACAQVIDVLLRHTPDLRILATSREPLRVDGENAWRVPSLGLGSGDPVTSRSAVLKIHSIRIFADRATARQSAFTLTVENAPAIVDICRRLDGIPLAIELAAALALASLARLIDASLVVAAGFAGGGRYRLLEPVRQYAMEELVASGERDAVLRRHARFFLTVAEEFEPVIRTGQRGPWLQQTEDDRDNFRASLDWCLRLDSTEDWETGARLAGSLRWYWVRAARVGEGRDWLERVLAASDRLTRRTRARVSASAGLLAWLGGDEAAARRWLEEGARLHGEVRDNTERAFALAIRGMVDESSADAELSETRLDESVRLFTSAGDDWGLAVAKQVHGRAFP